MSKPASLLKGFEKDVATAKPSTKRRVIFDKSTTGLALIVTPKGKKSFSIVARDNQGKQVWAKIGDPALMSVAEARQEAPQAVARVKAGQGAVLPPATPEAAPESFREVARVFMRDWVDRGGKKGDGTPLRGKGEIVRHFEKYIFPRWEAKPIKSINRMAITTFQNEIATNHGPVQADRVLATLSKLFNWYRTKDEFYANPIIPEMKRSASNSRERILTDAEIRAIWEACDKSGAYGALVKVALLTGQRRSKVATMKWSDIDQGVWKIAAEAREKVNAGSLKLPELALNVIEAQPQITGNPYVFAGRGKAALNSFSKSKSALDKKAGVAEWVFHDLRRTARSLMSRAGIRSEIAERTIGHTIRGVEGIYDRYTYESEKGEALAALASLIGRILSGDTDNVVQLATGR